MPANTTEAIVTVVKPPTIIFGIMQFRAFSFSTKPLKMATGLGLFTSVCAVLYMLFVIFQKLIVGIDVPGYATIIVLILLLGSMQLFCIGIIGEYVGRTFEQSKDRPIYIAKEVLDYSN